MVPVQHAQAFRTLLIQSVGEKVQFVGVSNITTRERPPAPEAEAGAQAAGNQGEAPPTLALPVAPSVCRLTSQRRSILGRGLLGFCGAVGPIQVRRKRRAE